MPHKLITPTLLGILFWVGAVCGATYAITGNPVSEATVAVSTSAVGISTCTDGQRGLIQVQGNTIYYRLDSSTATPDSGDYLGSVGDIIELDFPGKFRAIRVSADATVKVTCFD